MGCSLHTLVTQSPRDSTQTLAGQGDCCIPEGIVDITLVPALGDEHLLLSLPYPEPMTSGYWNLPAVLFPLWASSLLLKQDPNVAFATNGCLA